MGRRSLAGLALGLLSALLTACGDPYRGEPVYGPLFGPLSERSSDAVAAGAPDQVSLAEGRRVYDRFCQQCHPGGAAGLAPALNNKPAPGWLIRFQVRQGMGAMPAFPTERIDDQELDALVAYVLALRAHGSSPRR